MTLGRWGSSCCSVVLLCFNSMWKISVASTRALFMLLLVVCLLSGPFESIVMQLSISVLQRPAALVQFGLRPCFLIQTQQRKLLFHCGNSVVTDGCDIFSRPWSWVILVFHMLVYVCWYLCIYLHFSFLPLQSVYVYL